MLRYLVILWDILFILMIGQFYKKRTLQFIQDPQQKNKVIIQNFRIGSELDESAHTIMHSSKLDSIFNLYVTNFNFQWLIGISPQ